MYYDDLVVNNSLGSKTHAHKMGGFYYVIQNLPRHLNTFLGGIHVLALCYTADINKYGFAKILKPFYQELNRLESDDGVEVQCADEVVTLRASLACISADGLAAHQLFGLLSPSARHFCRQCMISRDELRQSIWMDFEPRTKDLHKKQLLDVQKDFTLSTPTGVREDSALHASKYFYFTENYTFDPMHDILEDIGQLELKLVILEYSTNCNYNFNVDQLNTRINLFQFGIMEIKNKPSANFNATALKNVKDHTIPQKAVQTWCLLRVLPFLVSDIVPENDKYIKLIILLNKINEIVFAPKVSYVLLAYLNELIRDHEALFLELFSEQVNPINKLHHLRHYPVCMQKSGPLRSLACLLFEAKHGYFKKFGSICYNYQNIPKTMIKMNQISQTATWGMNEEPRQKNTVIFQ